MNKIFGCATLLMVLFFSTNVYAGCVQNYNELSGLVGLDNPNGTVYADVKSASKECGCTNVRFYPTGTNTEMALSILMAAKVAGKKVRIDISDEDNCNSAYRVYIH